MRIGWRGAMRRARDYCLIEERSARRKDDRQALAAEATVNGEVTAVSGDDFCVSMDFRQDDKRGVGDIHTLVFHHQFLGPLQMTGPWLQELDGSRPDQSQQGVDGLRVTTQMPTRFAEDDLGGVDRPADRREGFDRPMVPSVGGIEPADQGAGITRFATSIAFACGEIRRAGKHSDVRSCQFREIHGIGFHFAGQDMAHDL